MIYLNIYSVLFSIDIKNTASLCTAAPYLKKKKVRGGCTQARTQQANLLNQT